MNRKSFWQGFATGGLVLIVVLIIVFFKIFKQPDIALNEMAVENLNGEKIELTAYKGKPLVVNYWATWCAPCINEFPHFEEMKNEYGNNVSFVMISDENIDKIKKFSESKPYSFDYLRSKKSLTEYGINTLPTTYFYDAQGELIKAHTSSLDSKSLKALIERIK